MASSVQPTARNTAFLSSAFMVPSTSLPVCFLQILFACHNSKSDFGLKMWWIIFRLDFLLAIRRTLCFALIIIWQMRWIWLGVTGTSLSGKKCSMLQKNDDNGTNISLEQTRKTKTKTNNNKTKTNNTHTHTHTHTHARTHTHTHTHARSTHARTHAHMNLRWDRKG